MDRLHIVLQDIDSGDVYNHGIAVAPVGVKAKEAKERINKAYQKAVDANPEEWNYDDVIQNLKDDGFDHIEAEVWTE